MLGMLGEYQECWKFANNSSFTCKLENINIFLSFGLMRLLGL